MLTPRTDLETLARGASPGVTVGIALTAGDPREAEIRSRASFCPLAIYRDGSLMLGDLTGGRIDAAVRGSLSATSFLEDIKARQRGGFRRVALLTLPEGGPFLLGPVGIDEGKTLRDMRLLAGDCREFATLLGWEPRVAVLSYGRPEDRRRGRDIRRSLRKGDRLAASEGLKHSYITIEEAVKWANCVIAPDGMAGNLIYRTLTRLGSGGSLGALYFPLSLRLADTSRSGSAEEYIGAVALANIAAQNSRVSQ